MPHEQGTPNNPIATSIQEVEALLIETARRGAQQILQQALEAEIEAHLEVNRKKLDDHGHRRVVRNGHAPQRTILTGVGPLEVSRPRADERKAIAADQEYEQWRKSKLSSSRYAYIWADGVYFNARDGVQTDQGG